jgi:hypothetical protein
MTYPITFLWTVPRSVSTSFERMMSERGDHAVFDEPFSRRYYFGPGRRSSRFAESLEGSSSDELLEELEHAAGQRPVFVKDMAYQAAGLLEPELLDRFRNSFLVRNPAATLRSLAGHWPDFTDEEAGWDALAQAAEVVEQIGQPFVVIDAGQLCHDPHEIVSEWCAEMDLPFVEEALRWEPGLRPEWSLWADWHASTARSTGFHELGEPPAPDGAEPRLLEAYERAQPVYERFLAHAVGPARAA